MDAENSPYYLSGAKVTYAPNAQWIIADVMVMDGNEFRELMEIQRLVLERKFSTNPLTI